MSALQVLLYLCYSNKYEDDTGIANHQLAEVTARVGMLHSHGILKKYQQYSEENILAADL